MKSRVPPVINYPQTTTFAFATPRVSRAQFPESTSVRDEIASFGIFHQEFLQRSKAIVIEIVSSMTLKGWEFDKRRFHGLLYVVYVYTQAALALRIRRFARFLSPSE